MDNKRKQRLAQIIKSIPDDTKLTVAELWRKYGTDFTYQTFKNYYYSLKN